MASVAMATVINKLEKVLAHVRRSGRVSRPQSPGQGGCTGYWITINRAPLPRRMFSSSLSGLRCAAVRNSSGVAIGT